jgi:hypothetical protein
VKPFSEGFSMSKKEQNNEIFARFDFSDIRFYYKDVQTLKVLATQKDTTEIQILLNGTLQGTGIVELLASVDDDKVIYEYNVKNDDIYTDIVDGYDTEINTITDSIDSVGVKSNTDFSELTFSSSFNFADGIGSLFGVFGGVNVYARQNLRVPDAVADSYIGSGGWKFVADFFNETDIARSFADSGLAAPTIGNFATVSNTAGDYLTSTTAQGHGTNDKFIYEGENMVYLREDSSGAPTLVNYALYSDRYYENITWYSRFRSLFDVVKYVVGQIDSTILFDSTGTTTDSFYYFISYVNPDTQNSLKNLFVSGVPDLILDDSGFQSSEPQTIGRTTFRKITDYLKEKFNIFWKLEDRSGSIYMVFKHWTETQKNTGKNADLNNWLNVNWTKNKNQYKYNSSEFYRLLKRKEIASGIDFVGSDIQTVGLNTEAIKELQFSTFFCDLSDLQASQSSYPDNSVTQFMLITTGGIQYGDQIVDATTFAYVNDLAPLFDNFTWVTDTITADSVAAAQCRTNFSITSGGVGGNAADNFQTDIEYTLTINSGATPVLNIEGVEHTLTAGNNTMTINVPYPNRWFITVSGASDFVLQWIDIKATYYEVLESTGALTGETKQNVALSVANSDAEHIGQIPSNKAIVNGIEITLASDEKLKVKNITEIQAPLGDYGLWFFDDLLTTDLGDVEIESITQQNNNSLAKFKLKF